MGLDILRGTGLVLIVGYLLVAVVFVGMILVYWVVRNLPLYPFSLLAP